MTELKIMGEIAALVLQARLSQNVFERVWLARLVLTCTTIFKGGIHFFLPPKKK